MQGISSLITAITRHRVAADVIMLIFILSGCYAIAKLTVRFFPPFETNLITTLVVQGDATSTEVEKSIVVPLENALRNVPDFKKIYSYSRENAGLVFMEFPDDVDLNKALEDIKAEVERVKLPSAAEAPLVFTAEFNLQVANLTVVGSEAGELRQLVRRLESDLNAQGIGKVTLKGIANQEIEVLVDQRKLIELNMSLAQVGTAIRDQNFDASIGSLTGLGNKRNLRANSESSELHQLAKLPISVSSDGGIIRLRDIATLRRQDKDNQISMRYNGQPAITMSLLSTGTGNIIDTADVLNAWIDKQRASLPPSVRIISHDEKWRDVQSRLNLLIDNGTSGMLIVLAILFTFLSFRVAIWVAAGIPVAMLGTLFVFLLFGGTINMLSMFALIMAVGIIVDDAIVVGENAQHRLASGAPPMRAVTSAARKMFIPVFASSLTTIATFMPLFLVGGVIGSIIFDIPLIICCILIIALIECFLVLPGHLYRSFAKRAHSKDGVVRRGIDHGFNLFRENVFRPTITFAVRHAFATIVACFVTLVMAVGLFVHGYLNYRFFPDSGGSKLFGTVTFDSGTPRTKVQNYIEHMLDGLALTDKQVDAQRQVVAHAFAFTGKGDLREPQADHRAQIVVELVDVDERDITSHDFAAAWRENVRNVPGIVQLDFRAESSGPPGRDIEIRLTAPSINDIKNVAEQVKEALANIAGVSSISDDTPFGKEEVIFQLTPLGRSLNMDIADVANQLRYAVDGFLVQTFTEGIDEVELKVKMDNFNDGIIETFYLRLPSGDFVPLREIVAWRTKQGFDQIQHQHGLPAIVVSADLAPNTPTTVGAILSELEDGILTDLRDTAGVSYSFEGKNANEQQTIEDMLTGLVLGVALIFIILTWVFNSWSLPLVVMVTMPMGVIGAIFGHWIMGQTMTILSFFGTFTLMGIIVNNSIVLVDCFKDLGADASDAKSYDAAIVDAACQRLRPVMLTSLTTIGGLLPLMFERSFQAQFLLPMAISLVFGLAFATVLILFFTPACMSLHGAIGRLLAYRIKFTTNVITRRRLQQP